jgi:hypothetical protein
MGQRLGQFAAGTLDSDNSGFDGDFDWRCAYLLVFHLCLATGIIRDG